VLEKSCPGDARGACCGGPKLPTSIVFSGRSQDKCLCAVFGIGAAFVGFVVDHCFHADGDERMPIIVVVFVDMCIRWQVWMRTRLS
jgi:hypothetical protein